MNMNSFEEFDKQFGFLLKTEMRSFLIVKIALTADYEHVREVLSNHIEAGVVFLHDEMDILETVSSLPYMCVLIHVNPCANTLFFRLNHVRDALKMLNKMFIFVFYESQYEKAIYEFPDFFAYAGTCLECKSQVPSPFAKLLSCNVLDYQSFVEYPREIRNLRAHRVGIGNNLIDIQKSINRLKYVRMNEVELEKLNRQILKLYENTNLAGSPKLVINMAIDYVEALVAKEKFELAKINIIDLFKFIIFAEVGMKPVNEPDIDSVISFCKNVASDDRNVYGRGVKVWANQIIKILVPYLLNDSKKVDLPQVLKLNAVRLNLIKDISSSSNELAQLLNDFALLLNLLNIDANICLEYLDDMEKLNLNYVSTFLCYCNKAVLLLCSGRYKEARSICDKFLYKSAEINYNKDNLQEVKISLLKNWIVGVYDRRLKQAIAFNVDVLKKHREVFSENHYSLAEIHYCNAFLYRESNNHEKSMACLKKAQNILKNNHSVRLKGLRDLVANFNNDLI